MTEPRIENMITTGAEHVEALHRWATDLALAAELVAGGSILDRPRVLGILEQIAMEMGCAISPFVNTFGAPGSKASEQTDRIILLGSETCSRCAGTGEVPIVVPVTEGGR